MRLSRRMSGASSLMERMRRVQRRVELSARRWAGGRGTIHWILIPEEDTISGGAGGTTAAGMQPLRCLGAARGPGCAGSRGTCALPPVPAWSAV